MTPKEKQSYSRGVMDMFSLSFTSSWFYMKLRIIIWFFFGRFGTQRKLGASRKVVPSHILPIERERGKIIDTIENNQVRMISKETCSKIWEVKQWYDKNRCCAVFLSLTCEKVICVVKSLFDYWSLFRLEWPNHNVMNYLLTVV